METCTLKYFFEYYAAAVGTPFDPARKPLVQACKAMSSVAAEGGKIVHTMIRIFLAKRPDVSASWFIKTAATNFDKNVTYSRNPVGLAWQRNQQFPPVLLAEFAYGDAEAEQKAAAAREQMIACLARFFRDPAVHAVYAGSIGKADRVEVKIGGLKIAGCGVDGQIDLWSPTSEDGIEIVDWKTGKVGITQDSLQLAVYGLWAMAKKSVPVERIVVRKVFLGDDSTLAEPTRLDAALLRRGKVRMIQDVERMMELDEYGRLGLEGAFTPCGNPNVCRHCEFKAVCSTGCSVTGLKPTSVSLPVLKLVG
jgi:hypothetical protein